MQAGFVAGIGPGQLQAARAARSARRCGSRRPAGARRSSAAPRRNSQPPSPAAADQHAGGAIAQRVFDERRRQLAGAEQAERSHVGAGQRLPRARRGRSRRRRSAARPAAPASRCCSLLAQARRPVNCGMSMPVTSSAALRNGVDDGQAPAQMPQPAHRSASTCASCLPTLLVRVRHHRDRRRRGNRRSSAGSRCSWPDRPRPRARAPAAAGRAARTAAASCRRPGPRRQPATLASVSGCRNSRIQSSAQRPRHRRQIGRRVAGHRPRERQQQQRDQQPERQRRAAATPQRA